MSLKRLLVALTVALALCGCSTVPTDTSGATGAKWHVVRAYDRAGNKIGEWEGNMVGFVRTMDEGVIVTLRFYDGDREVCETVFRADSFTDDEVPR